MKDDSLGTFHVAIKKIIKDEKSLFNTRVAYMQSLNYLGNWNQQLYLNYQREGQLYLIGCWKINYIVH